MWQHSKTAVETSLHSAGTKGTNAMSQSYHFASAAIEEVFGETNSGQVADPFKL